MSLEDTLLYTGSPDAHGCCLAPILPFGGQLDYTLTLFSLMSSPYADHESYMYSATVGEKTGLA